MVIPIVTLFFSRVSRAGFFMTASPKVASFGGARPSNDTWNMRQIAKEARKIGDEGAILTAGTVAGRIPAGDMDVYAAGARVSNSFETAELTNIDK